MKCEVVIDSWEISPQADPVQVRGQSVAKRIKRNGQMVDRLFWRVGAILCHPDAALAVKHGVAIPADEECRAAVGLSVEELRAKQHAYKRMEAGIHHDDWAAYDAGYLLGYQVNPVTGEQEWIPGPSGGQDEYEALFEEQEDEDDD